MSGWRRKSRNSSAGSLDAHMAKRRRQWHETAVSSGVHVLAHVKTATFIKSHSDSRPEQPHICSKPCLIGLLIRSILHRKNCTSASVRVQFFFFFFFSVENRTNLRITWINRLTTEIQNYLLVLMGPWDLWNMILMGPSPRTLGMGPIIDVFYSLEV